MRKEIDTVFPAILALLVAFSSMARAGERLAALEHAAEIPLPALRLPAVAPGTVEFAVCEGCPRRATAIPSAIEYRVNGRAATFEAFAAAVRTARDAPDIAGRSLVGLYFEAASQRLVRIALVAPLPAPVEPSKTSRAK